MAPVALTRLRREAIDAGMPRAEARAADRDALLDFLVSDEDGAGTPKAAKKVVKKAVAKKKVAAPAKKKAANGRRTRAAVKPVRKQTRKPAARKGNGNVGRAEIGMIDYSVENDAWKPRQGSPVELIWKSLKRHRDDVDKVFSELRTQLDKFTEPKSRTTGVRKSKIEREATLRYRINRTRFEYAVRTGQHESGTERVKYGEGDYAQGGKNGRRKAAPAKRGPGRPKKVDTLAPRRRGRPPGSKNRSTTTRKPVASRKRKIVRR